MQSQTAAAKTIRKSSTNECQNNNKLTASVAVAATRNMTVYKR